MTPILAGVAVLVAIGLICGALAFATGGVTPPPPRDTLDDELEALIASEGDGRG